MLELRCFGYMTDLQAITTQKEPICEISAEGFDMESFVFSFMNELLYAFNSELSICKQIHIANLDISEESYKATAKCFGEKFNPQKHEQGTEVKAITYSNMKIEQTKERCDIWVIVDI
eukprot:GILJ01015499.1.p1 GENE.GILJ01015499.1~~GILJ01015499.1.p1  ORF type:complete len:118 (-),score=14.59 GILJ01015499.1:35-388(-)